MRSVKSASIVVSKVNTATPFVFFFFSSISLNNIFRRARGRPPTKKDVRTSKYVDNEEEV